MKRQFLAVDDERLALDDLLNALSRADPEAETRGFCSPAEALRSIREEGFRPQAAFLDIQMRGRTGLELAAELKQLLPELEIIFVTAHPQYALESYSLHARGYLLKPVTVQAVKDELKVIYGAENTKLTVSCFGSFEVFFEGKPLKFPRAKSKELFAYLIFRGGASCSIKEIAGILFEDLPYDSAIKNQIQTFKSDLMKLLRSVGCERAVIKGHNCLSVDPSVLECDYYRLLEGSEQAASAFTGEFMVQYSWAEPTAAALSSRLC